MVYSNGDQPPLRPTPPEVPPVPLPVPHRPLGARMLYALCDWGWWVLALIAILVWLIDTLRR
jgi:hypothetical protein